MGLDDKNLYLGFSDVKEFGKPARKSKAALADASLGSHTAGPRQADGGSYLHA